MQVGSIEDVDQSGDAHDAEGATEPGVSGSVDVPATPSSDPDRAALPNCGIAHGSPRSMER